MRPVNCLNLNEEAITGIPYEPWHYRYVGREAAGTIMERGLCLEEYLEETGAPAADLT